MKKALLVIDLQDIYLGKHYSENLISSANKIISDNIDSTIVYIKNIYKLPLNCESLNFAANLNIVSENIFNKHAGNAFTNPELKKFLDSKQIDTVEVIGIDGGACVSLTALGAVKEGYKVILNTEAIGTKSSMENRRLKYFEKLKALGSDII